MTIYISVSCVRMLPELVTDTCGRGKVYMRWKMSPRVLQRWHQSPVCREALGCFRVVINLLPTTPADVRKRASLYYFTNPHHHHPTQNANNEFL